MRNSGRKEDERVIIFPGLPKKRKKWFFRAIFIALAFTASTIFAQNVPMEIKALENELRHIAQNPELVNAVIESNKELYPMSKIRALENEWRVTWEGTGIVKPVLTNKAALFLAQIKWTAHHPGMFHKISVMNKQGLIIAAVEKGEHYYWGDQQEFLKAYAEGHGAVYYGNLEYDAYVYSIKVGVPIKDPDSGKVIGVISFDINMDAL